MQLRDGPTDYSDPGVALCEVDAEIAGRYATSAAVCTDGDAAEPDPGPARREGVCETVGRLGNVETEVYAWQSASYLVAGCGALFCSLHSTLPSRASPRRHVMRRR